MKTLRQSTAFSIGNSAIQVVTSVISGVLVARMLGVDGKGEIFLVLQFSMLGAALITLGLPSSLVYHMRQGRITTAKAVAFITAACSAAAVVLVLARQYGQGAIIAITGGALDPSTIDLLLWLTFVQACSAFLTHAVMGMTGGVVTNSVHRMISALFYLLSLLYCYAFHRISPREVMLLLLVSAVANVVLASQKLLRSLDGGPATTTPGAVNTLFRFGASMYLSNLMMTSLLRVDTYFVNSVLGTRSLGQYSAAVAVSELLLVVPTAVGVAHFQHMAGRDTGDPVASAALVFRFSVVFALAGSFALSFLGYPALLVFGRDFLPALPAFYWLLPGITAMAAIFPLANFFNSQGRPSISLVCFATMVAANVVLNLLLLRPLGIVGASLASSITYVVAVGLFLAFFRRHTGRSLRELMVPRREDLVVIRQLFSRIAGWRRSCAE